MRSVGAATEDLVVVVADVPPQAVRRRDSPTIVLTNSAPRETRFLGVLRKYGTMKITPSVC